MGLHQYLLVSLFTGTIGLWMLMMSTGPFDSNAALRKWGARLLVGFLVWPVLVPSLVVLAARGFYYAGLGSNLAGRWLWRTAELPVPKVLRPKVYDADAGALSEPEFQAGELSTVLPPPARPALQIVPTTEKEIA